MNKIGNFEKYPAYKDSGVEWLGEIPDGWDVKRLGYLANCSPSNIDKHSKNNEKTVRLCNYTDVYKNDFITDDMDLMIATASDEQIERYALRAGDIIITKDSETANDIAVPAYIKETLTNVVCGYHLAMIRPYSGLCGKYLFRSFQTKIFNVQFEICSNGITRVGLGSNDLKHGLFLTPPLPEQTAIAAFLDEKTVKIDTAIAQKEQMISLLKERKQILIQNAVTKGINPDAKMKDSGVEWIGEIPEGWGMRRIKNIFRLIIDPSEINNNHELLSIYTDIGVKPRKELEERGNKASTTDGYLFVKKGDFIVNKLLAWMGAIGLSEYDGVTSPAYDILRPQKPISGMYYHYLFRTASCSIELKKHSRGIMDMRLRLYFDKFGALLMPYPSATEQAAIVVFIETQSAKIDTAISIQQQQIAKLKEYKSILIDSAVTGKIKVC